jgi:uncharacterized protein YbjT (DUF2867 family)
MSRVLVTGGTGGLGRAVAPLLIQQGHTVRVLSRRARKASDWPEVEWASANLETGAGLTDAVWGMETILHCATRPSTRTRQMDVEGTRRLVAEAKAAGLKHFFHVSIVGVERIPFPYYQHKVASEKVVVDGGVPWTILRATQFHSLLDGFFRPLKPFPFLLLDTHLQFQPIDTDEVAAHLADSVGRGPVGRLPDIGGPEILQVGELFSAWLAAQKMNKPVVHVPFPGGFPNALRQGYNTCPDQKFGKVTWGEWVKKKYTTQ